jgi:hypothetical protein
VTQPTDWHSNWQTFRSVLEVLYFISGVGIFAAACYAARQVMLASQQLKIASDQLKLTKEIADANSRREAVRLAAIQCRYFAEEVLTSAHTATSLYAKEQCTFLNPQASSKPAFLLKDGDFKQVNFDHTKIPALEWNKMNAAIVDFLNKAESFAIPFAAGVADDGIGFQETAPAFVTLVQGYMPAIYYLRMTQSVGFASVLKLFNIWHDRAVANSLTPEIMKGIQGLIEAADRNKIKAI